MFDPASREQKGLPYIMSAEKEGVVKKYPTFADKQCIDVEGIGGGGRKRKTCLDGRHIWKPPPPADVPSINLSPLLCALHRFSTSLSAAALSAADRDFVHEKSRTFLSDENRSRRRVPNRGKIPQTPQPTCSRKMRPLWG